MDELELIKRYNAYNEITAKLNDKGKGPGILCIPRIDYSDITNINDNRSDMEKALSHRRIIMNYGIQKRGYFFMDQVEYAEAVGYIDKNAVDDAFKTGNYDGIKYNIFYDMIMDVDNCFVGVYILSEDYIYKKYCRSCMSGEINLDCIISDINLFMAEREKHKKNVYKSSFGDISLNYYPLPFYIDKKLAANSKSDAACLGLFNVINGNN